MRPDHAERLFPEVSRETWDRLDAFVALVVKWQRAVNLVSAASLPAIWDRHILDSLQMARLAPAAQTWVDLGSGGGFPGIVIAAERPDLLVHLVESDQRKAAFLRESGRALGLNVSVHCERIEVFTARQAGEKFDVVSARALASLDRLIELAYPLLKSGAVGLFLKGAGLSGELTDARKSWMFQHEILPSVTSAEAGVLILRGAEPRDRKTSE